MNKKINSIRGMHDYFPEELYIWQKIEKQLKQVLKSYCYEEIRFPIIENTQVFQRTIGNATDIIEKEMYTFKDKKGISLSLRPEGTVGCVRAIIQNNLRNNIKRQKFWYLGPMFRYERPQKGRYRQFYQLGVEAFGIKQPIIDLEIILLTYRFWKMLGIENNLTLEINSIGNVEDRIQYQKELVFFLKKYKNSLDEESKKRLYNNPFRILDSKNVYIQEILKKAPLLKNYINVSARKQFNDLLNMIDANNIKYIYNYNLVRGLDYYNNTVFEWKANRKESKNTICAGGRYDYLMEKLGGSQISAIGFAIGMERLVTLVKSLKIFPQKIENVNIYIIFIENINKIHAIRLSEDIRNIYPKLKIFIDFFECNLSKKIKNAIKTSAKIAILIGSNEIKKNCFLIKDLTNKKEYFFSKKELMLKLKNIFKNT